MEFKTEPSDHQSLIEKYSELSEKYVKLQQDYARLEKENTELQTKMVTNNQLFEQQIAMLNEELAKLKGQNQQNQNPAIIVNSVLHFSLLVLIDFL